jgi:endonuclease YncB( thermonuclease family)
MMDDWDWYYSTGTHYRELASWLRETAGRCKLPNPQRELLALAHRYERRADHLDRRGRHRRLKWWRQGALCLAIALSSPALAVDLAGAARVIDGDTIDTGSTRIRLWGIDAPEREQTCQGKNGDVYECGRDATAVLSELTRGRQVECAQRDIDRYGRVVAVCRTESGELNVAMVRRGWAVDYTKYSRGRYRSDEEEARREQLGIWSGSFGMPWDWRHRR